MGPRLAAGGNSGHVIAIDWGTSSLRAALMAPDSSILDEIASPDGIMFADGRSFEEIFRSLFAKWIALVPHAEVIASGMIGSRQGWIEAPYIACPAGFGDLAGALSFVDVAGMARVGFVPGLSVEHADGMPDVMRGEETQVFGALASLGISSGVFVLPGTHSKWVRVQQRRITGFCTFLTGESFDVLRRHSILGRQMSEQPLAAELTGEAFDLGCELSRVGHVLHHLFSVRSRSLFGRTPPSALPDYLSGLLIGEEIREAKALFGQSDGGQVHLIGRSDLASRYKRALAHYGIEASVIDPGVTFAGLFSVARRRRSRVEA